MTIKETYSLGNDADCWVDIPLKTFQVMRKAGYPVYYMNGDAYWVQASDIARDDLFAYDSRFRTKHSEYMRYINRTFPIPDDAERQADLVEDFTPEYWRRVNYAIGGFWQSGERTAPSARKSRPDLLPSKAVLAAGRVLAFGLSKHPDEKWKTLSVEDHVAASLRHIYQHQDGPDEETGESHLAHALCRIAFAIARESE